MNSQTNIEDLTFYPDFDAVRENNSLLLAFGDRVGIVEDIYVSSDGEWVQMFFPGAPSNLPENSPEQGYRVHVEDWKYNHLRQDQDGVHVAQMVPTTQAQLNSLLFEFRGFLTSHRYNV